jgi:hypothetical protein
MQSHLAIQPFLEPSLLSHGYETAGIAVLVDERPVLEVLCWPRARLVARREDRVRILQFISILYCSK